MNYTITLWAISFCALYFAMLWIVILREKEPEMLEKPKLKKYPSLTLIIPSKNGAEKIARTISSLLKVQYPKDKLDIIVSLNGCTDNTKEIVESFGDKRISIIESRISNKSAALNRAIKIAKGELVGCLDDDSIITPSAIKYMIPFFEDKKVGAVIPNCNPYHPKKLIEKLQVMEYALSALARKLLSKISSLYVTPGVLSIYKKDALLKVGGFDENSLTEDFEVAVRLQRFGYDIQAQLNSITYTDVPKTFATFHRQRMRWFRGFLATVYKHRKMMFSQKCGLLGAFILPFITILAFLSTIAMTIIFSDIAHRIYALLVALSTTSFSNLVSMVKYPSIIDLNPLMFIVAVLLVCAVFLLNKSYKYTKNTWRYPLATLLFFTLYQTLLTAYWLFAMGYEILKVKEKW